MNWKCLFGFHKWEKFMGLSNVGKGKFLQRYKCKKCNKITSKPKPLNNIFSFVFYKEVID